MKDYKQKSTDVPGQTQPVPGREHEMEPHLFISGIIT